MARMATSMWKKMVMHTHTHTHTHTHSGTHTHYAHSGTHTHYAHSGTHTFAHSGTCMLLLFSTALTTDVLYRTDFFPGLGWMLTKALWKELKPKWPLKYVHTISIDHTCIAHLENHVN